MSSIIQGYEYDIFISYRHKDNQYDGWVTEFAENLKKELHATIKEGISIYFDQNPHDGLLETDHVDKSLERKLKCLILIPILSQTYCDKTSFAWRHEFCAFNSMASNDPYGMYIRLANGNVGSRILPVKIHELEHQDEQLIESELGGSLRCIDFIYRTPGVNRPLRAAEDQPKENLNHIFYRDQINKVANTIKQTIAGMRMKGALKETLTAEEYQEPETIIEPTSRRTIINFSIIGSVLLMAALAYYFFLRPVEATTTSTVIDRSIAVLPFVDLSPKKDQEYFSDGLSEELLNVLAKVPDLKVISRTSAFSYKGKNIDIRTIGEELGVAHVLEGSVRKSGDQIRITAQLIQVNDGSHIWSETYDRVMDDIFKVQDEIAGQVAEKLKLTLSRKSNPSPTEGNSKKYTLFLQGNYFFALRGAENVATAVDYYKAALDLDDNDARTWAALSSAYAAQANNGYIDHVEGYSKSRDAAESAIERNPNAAEGYAALAWIKSTYDWDWAGAEEAYANALQKDPSNFSAINGLANLMWTTGRFEEAIKLYNRGIELDPLRIVLKLNLAMTLIHAGRPAEAVVPLQNALKMNPNFPTIHYNLGLISLLQGNNQLALDQVNKEREEDWKMQGLALIYSKTGNTKKADSLLQVFIAEYQTVSAYQIAEVYAYQDNADQAFHWLNKAYEQRDGGLTTIHGDPWLKPIQDDPRYTDFIKKLRLNR